MSKKKLLALALVGAAFGLCTQGFSGGSQGTSSTMTTPAPAPMTPEEKAFYDKLNPDAKPIFEQMTPEARQHAMDMAQKGNGSMQPTSQNEMDDQSQGKGKKNKDGNVSMNDDASSMPQSPNGTNGNCKMPPQGKGKMMQNNGGKQTDQGITPPPASNTTSMNDDAGTGNADGKTPDTMDDVAPNPQPGKKDMKKSNGKTSSYR